MSILGRTFSTRLIGPLVVLLLLVALLPALSSTPAREVTLVARGMAFYLDGDFRTPNPTIEMRVGERVRIVLRNQDRGMTHDFAVPALDAALSVVRWNDSGEVVVEAPGRPGSYQYVCRPHSLMMHGTIRVIP